jgi:hypothetical protein
MAARATHPPFHVGVRQPFEHHGEHGGDNGKGDQRAAPRDELEAMPDRGTVRLIVGQGRLGMEWLKGIELP